MPILKVETWGGFRERSCNEAKVDEIEGMNETHVCSLLSHVGDVKMQRWHQLCPSPNQRP